MNADRLRVLLTGQRRPNETTQEWIDRLYRRAAHDLRAYQTIIALVTWVAPSTVWGSPAWAPLTDRGSPLIAAAWLTALAVVTTVGLAKPSRRFIDLSVLFSGLTWLVWAGALLSGVITGGLAGFSGVAGYTLLASTYFRVVSPLTAGPPPDGQ